MNIKDRDSKEQDIAELQDLLDEKLSSKQRFLIERELKSIKSGLRGEDDAAYFINFYHSNSKNWAVIHDLRIEHEGQVAQIDHLLINRMFEVYVLESKSYAYGINITEAGEFEAQYKTQSYGIESPIEQNKRHIAVLKKLFKDKAILPKRLGIKIQPTFKSFILVYPKSIIKRPNKKEFDTSCVIKADTLRTAIDREVDKFNPTDLALIAKISSSKTVQEVGAKLASYHTPIQIDFKAKFGIKSAPSEEVTSITLNAKEKWSRPDLASDKKSGNIEPPVKKTWSKSKFFCSQCKTSITEKAAKFCFNNKTKFGGKAYCFDCQKQAAS